MSIVFEVNLPEFLNYTRRVYSNLESAEALAMRQISYSLLLALRKNAPKRTGRLSSSFREEVISKDYIRIGSDSRYLNYVSGGTRPHIIEAKIAKVLHFTAQDGSERFVKRVFHPGTEPNDFVVQSMAEIRLEVLGIFSSMIRDAVNKP